MIQVPTVSVRDPCFQNAFHTHYSIYLSSSPVLSVCTWLHLADKEKALGEFE